MKKPPRKNPRKPAGTRSKPARKNRAKVGEDLFNQVVALTGIPAKTIQRELNTILERKNIDIHHLTLDQLRGVVASYLREIMGNVLDRCSPRRTDPTH